MRYMTAGESHGKGLTAILEGFPAGVPVNVDEVNKELRRRQAGYGRGGRMKIESDALDITAGVFGGVTLGSPIAFFIPNRDFAKWQPYTDPVTGQTEEKALMAVRPGHDDYTGCLKYGFTDARYVLERASARETAARVGVGAFCKQLLARLGITVHSHVVNICGEKNLSPIGDASTVNERADRDPVRCLSAEASKRMVDKIDACMASGDTAGGEAEILIAGVPAGIGSYVQYDRKLDALLAEHLTSIQAVKSVSFGLGAHVADTYGSNVHDEMFPDGNGGVVRKTNRAGGIEGGMSNGETIVMRIAVKPIPTLMRGLCTVDIRTGKAVRSAPERSDYCAVPAAGVVAENVAAFVISNELLRVTGGDDLATIERRVRELRERTKR